MSVYPNPPTPALLGSIEPHAELLRQRRQIEKVPSGDRWIMIRFDGYRVQLHIANQDVKVFTRNGHDWKRVADAAFLIIASSAIIDGEIVVPAPDRHGRVRPALFQWLRSAGRG